MTTNSEAYNDTMARIKAKWDTVIPAAPILYPNVPLDTAMQACITAGLEPWARVSYMPNLRDVTSIAGPTNSKETAEGIVMVEVYTPNGDGGLLDRTLTALMETAFAKVSTSNGVWYRKVRTEAALPDGPWIHSNVIANWEFDEVR